jgi:hypothetical protein
MYERAGHTSARKTPGVVDASHRRSLVTIYRCQDAVPVSLQVRLHHATALRTSSLAVGVCTDAWSTNIHVRHPSPSHAHRMHPRHSLRCAASNP